jgi:hypothetical protein
MGDTFPGKGPLFFSGQAWLARFAEWRFNIHERLLNFIT